MSGPAFFQTRMGQVFFDVTMPKIADQLVCLTRTLQLISDVLVTSHERAAGPDVEVPPPASDLTGMSISSDDADMAEMFAQIARRHLGIATLEERKRDSLDLHEVSVRSVIAALGAAYDVGFAAGVRHSPQ